MQTVEDLILLVGTLVAFLAFVLWCCFPVVPKEPSSDPRCPPHHHHHHHLHHHQRRGPPPPRYDSKTYNHYKKADSLYAQHPST